MNKDMSISVENLWKQYGLPLRHLYLKGRDWCGGMFGSKSRAVSTGGTGVSGSSKPWALQDVSFTVARGETLGIIGRNGAGKSTLLKVLAGVTPPTMGKTEMAGRIFPMIELNAGVHPELTGRENVYLLGAIIGLTRKETSERIQHVEDFCELGEWFDRPVRMYSSGMLARLGFGVAMNADADILLVDEILAVGDLAFQKKCYDHIERLQSRDVTTLFVSHNIRQVERMCDRALLLDQGRIVRIGPVKDVANLYYERSHEKSLQQGAQSGPRHFEGTGEIVIGAVDILDDSHRAVNKVRGGRSIGIRLSFRTTGAVDQPVLGIGILTLDMIPVMVFSNDNVEDRPSFDGEGTYDLFLPDIPLLTGIYSIKVKIIHKNGAVLFGAEDMARFQIVSPAEGETNLSQAGLVKADVVWDSQPAYPAGRKREGA